jgi:UTP--glucose-1-phosphate uridylyltransferase
MSARDRRGVVRKCVFPVAGFGTRFLPATKACPKEMLPIVDRPLIQYAVDEAAAAGITDMIFVTGRNKRAIEDHFDHAYELEHELAARDNRVALEQVRSVVPRGVTFSYIRQTQMRGLGDAVLRARPAVGDEPFAVILPDDLIDADPPALAQLIEVHQDACASVVAVETVPASETHRYGIVALDAPLDHGAARMTGIVEKPRPAVAPSQLGVVGRYVLTPAIWSKLAATAPSAGGEVQLTDAIAQLMQDEPVFAASFKGRRYDCGNQLGYLEAQFGYARKRPELWHQLVARLEQVVGEGESLDTLPLAHLRATERGARITPLA